MPNDLYNIPSPSTQTLKTDESLGYTPNEFGTFKKFAWRALIIFSVLYCFVYCGRLNLGLSIPLMSKEMGWTIPQLGILSSIVFWTYGFGHLFNGRLSEILGTKRIIVLGVFLTVTANLLVSIQDSILTVAIIWGFNGYFQSMIWSPGLLFISKWWPDNTRGFAYGIATGASALSSVIVWLTVYLSFILFPEAGWRAAFTFPLIFMLLFIIIFILFTKDSPQRIGLNEYIESNKELAAKEDEMKKILQEGGKLYPYLFLLKQWNFSIWLLIIAFSSIARYGLLTWIPLYYVSVFDVNIKDGLLATIGLPVGMACGAIIVPWLTDKYCPHNRNIAVVICAVLAGAVVLIFSQAPPGQFASFLLFASGFFIYSINGIAWVYATAVGGRVFSGTAAGVLDWAAYMGAAVQAILFGSILGGIDTWNYVFMAIGVICGLIAIFSTIISIFSQKKA